MPLLSKHRYIDTFFWDDSFIRKLDADGKLLFIYLLTNPLTQICGAYEIDLDRMSFDTGLQPHCIRDKLVQFEKAGKMAYRDGWIGIRNWIKHNGKSPYVMTGIRRQLEQLPRPVALWIDGKGDSDSLPETGEDASYRDGDRDGDPVSTPVATARQTSPQRKIDFDYTDGKWVDITEEQIARWTDAYPAISIERELRKAAEWVLANPTKRKKNWYRFLVNWFDRAQERGGR